MSYAALLKEAKSLALELKRLDQRVVFAESCTGGLAAGALASVPGVSKYFCGSFVTYRDDSKIRWLGVSRAVAQRGAVQPHVAIAMAKGALKKTPEADFAAAITGHLGPKAPKGQDGLVFFAAAWRSKSRVQVRVYQSAILPQQPRQSKLKQATQGAKLREKRQVRASHEFLRMVRSLLKT